MSNKTKIKTVKIEVTERDILRGIPRDPCECMIARSVRRRFRTKAVEVVPDQEFDGSGICKINGDSLFLPIRASQKAVKFDERFDPEEGEGAIVKGRARLKIIKPFSFNLSVVPIV